MGKHIGWGLISLEPSMWQGLELSVSPLNFWGGRRGWRLSPMANDLINSIRPMKWSLHENLKGRSLKNFWVSEHEDLGRVVCLERVRKHFNLFPDLVLGISSIWMFICILDSIVYNNQVNEMFESCELL